MPLMLDCPIATTPPRRAHDDSCEPSSARIMFAALLQTWVGRILVLGLGVAACAAHAGAAAPKVQAEAATARDFSQAETQLLMSDQLSRLKLPSTLNYAFVRRGTLEPGFEDKVSVRVNPKGSGGCCVVDSNFLSGERKVSLPPIDDAQGNPVTLYFLEHDIREMKRLTKGSTTYFRKRVRMAIYGAATIDAVQFDYRGQPVKGHQIVVEPYLDDPNRARFETMIQKQYVFTLSDAVPGVVAAIRTRVPSAQGVEPLWTEALLLEGVQPPPMPTIRKATAAPSTPSPAAPPGASSPR